MRFFVPVLLFLALFGLTTAETYFVTEGANVTGQCRFRAGGVKKIFCRNDCNRKEDILVEMSGDSARNGRYSIEYSRLADARVMHVSIAHVTSADSGAYQCLIKRVVSTARRKISFNVTAFSPPANSLSTEQSRSPFASDHNDSPEDLHYLLLLILIPAILVILVIFLVIYKKKMMDKDCGYAQNAKTIQENIYTDSTYQSLSPDTRDHNQIYCSLNTPRPSNTVGYYN